NVAPSKLTLHGNFYYGKALGQHFAHIEQQGNIRGWGAWAQAGYDFDPHWSLWAHYGMDQPDAARFTRETGGTLTRQLSHVGDALGPTVWIKRPQKSLKILQWSHFVPSYDVWFDKYAKDWGTGKGVEVTVDHISLADLGTRANAEVAAQQGHDLFQFLSPPGAFEPQVLDMADVVKEAEKQNGPLLDLCKRSTYNPVTRKWFGFSDNYVPDPGDYLKSFWT